MFNKPPQNKVLLSPQNFELDPSPLKKIYSDVFCLWEVISTHLVSVADMARPMFPLLCPSANHANGISIRIILTPVFLILRHGDVMNFWGMHTPKKVFFLVTKQTSNLCWIMLRNQSHASAPPTPFGGVLEKSLAELHTSWYIKGIQSSAKQWIFQSRHSSVLSPRPTEQLRDQESCQNPCTNWHATINNWDPLPFISSVGSRNSHTC